MSLEQEVSWRTPYLLSLLYQTCPGKYRTCSPQSSKSVPENTVSLVLNLTKISWKTSYLVSLDQKVSWRTPNLLSSLQQSVPENIVPPVFSPATININNRHFYILLTIAKVGVLPANISASFFHQHLESSKLQPGNTLRSVFYHYREACTHHQHYVTLFDLEMSIVNQQPISRKPDFYNRLGFFCQRQARQDTSRRFLTATRHMRLLFHTSDFYCCYRLGIPTLRLSPLPCRQWTLPSHPYTPSVK